MSVFWYDLIRTTRRGRAAALRTAYAIVLLVVLGGAFVHQFPGSLSLERLFAPVTADRRANSMFAIDFATICLSIQFAAAVVLTPIYAAGAIAEDRQRGTLDSILVTGLSAWAIVFGRFAARWLIVAGLLITGLPVLALTQLWGGVSWRFLAFGTGVTLLTTLSLAGIGMFCSVRAKSVRAAVAETCVFAAVLEGCAAIFIVPLFQPTGPWSRMHRFGFYHLLDNPDPTLLIALAGFAIWHVAICLTSLVSAVWLLRPEPVSKVERNLLVRAYRRLRAAGWARLGLAPRLLRGALPTFPSTGPPALRRTRILPVPQVGGDPLLWKELNFGGPAAAAELFRVIVYGLIGGGLTVGLTFILIRQVGALAAQRRDTILAFIPVSQNIALTVLAAITVGAALRAAGSIGRERERQTLDNLLVLPGGRDAVLWAKWLGSVLWTRWLALGLVAVLLLGVLAGATHVAVLFWLAVAGVIHAAFVASLGLLVSVRMAGPVRAMVVTLFCLAAAWTLPLLASAYWIGWFPALAHQWPWVTPLMQDGLTPPMTWRFLATATTDPPPIWMTNDRLAGVLLGLTIYAVAAWALWRLALVSFRRSG